MPAEYPDLPYELLVLDKALSDPFIKRAIERAHEYNELLKEDVLDELDQSQIVDELDTMVGNVIGAQVGISGVLYFRDDTGEGRSTGYLEDVPAEVRGFCVRSNHQNIKEVCQSFMVKKESIGYYGPTDDDPDVGCWSPVGMVQVEYKDMSPERAEAWMESSYPDLAFELREIFFNAEDKEQALLSLSDHKNLLHSINTGSEMDVRSIELYLGELVPFDLLCPYEAVITGEMTAYTDDDATETHHITQPSTFLILPRSISITSLDTSEVTSRQLMVDFMLIPDSLTLPSTHMSVALGNIKQLTSLRKAFYGK